MQTSIMWVVHAQLIEKRENMKSCGLDKINERSRGKIIFEYSMTLVCIAMEIMWNIIM